MKKGDKAAVAANTAKIAAEAWEQANEFDPRPDQMTAQWRIAVANAAATEHVWHTIHNIVCELEREPLELPVMDGDGIGRTLALTAWRQAKEQAKLLAKQHGLIRSWDEAKAWRKCQRKLEK
jgi:hypothetical protein